MSMYQLKQSEYQKGDKVFIYRTDTVGISAYEEATVLRALKTKTTVARKVGVLPEAPIETLEIKNNQQYRLNCWFIADLCKENEKILFDMLAATQRLKDERAIEAKNRLERSQARYKDRVKEYKQRFPLPKEDPAILSQMISLPDGSCLYQKIFDRVCLPLHLQTGNECPWWFVQIHIWSSEEPNFRTCTNESVASAAYTFRNSISRGGWSCCSTVSAAEFYLEKDDKDGLLLNILAQMYSEFVQNFRSSS